MYLEIGKGTSPTGSFAAVNWGVDQFFIRVEMDPLGGVAFQNMGTSQLLSVPYALYAKDVQNGDNWGTGYVRTDATLSGQGTVASQLKLAPQGAAAGQILKWSGSSWLPADDGGSLWSKSGSNLYYMSGNVGIGKSNPTSQLHIFTDDKTGFSVDNTSASATLWAGNSGTGPAAHLKGKIKIVDGTEGVGKVLTSDASGLASWQATGGGATTPGGVAGNVQFNGGGVFAGDNNLFWNNTSKRLGIGTTSPTAPLDITLNSSTATSQLMLTETEADFSRMSFKNTSNSTKVWTIAGKADAADASSQLNFYYHNGTVGTNLFTLTGNERAILNGQLGIGMTPTIDMLEIYKSDLNYIRMFNSASGSGSSNGFLMGIAGLNTYVWNYENGLIQFGTNNATRMTILASGNIGIGDLTPDATLDVEGTVVVGAAGVPFAEIREITGTLDADGAFSFAYPSGYTNTNMRVLSLEVNYNGNAWVGLASTVGYTTDIPKLFYYLGPSIIIYYPNQVNYQNRAFRMLVMKIP